MTPTTRIAVETAAAALWSAIGYDNTDGGVLTYEEAARRTDANEPGFRHAKYVRSVRSMTIETLRAYEEAVARQRLSARS